MTTKRKPYVRGMEANWWRKLGFYRFYMLREGTSIPTIWFSVLVLYGLFALKGGPESWSGFVSFLQNPLVLLINIITLLATLLHTKTWFELAPKALNIIVNNEKMPPEPIIKLLWTITIIATVVILGVALFF
ncbi:fumarate reductase subunit FrdC [Xenorhabdus thailandensis]|uniref:fumarate reductase subunit FrdC n=1 Tax=Xenorhabdus thailandensis TaxID=3136255 RepID=UPI0030F48ACC